LSAEVAGVIANAIELILARSLCYEFIQSISGNKPAQAGRYQTSRLLKLHLAIAFGLPFCACGAWGVD